MSVSFATFDRLKSKGVEAYKSGEYVTAKAYLVDAAECMIELATAAKTDEARRQHEELAKECERLQAGGRGRRDGGTKGRRDGGGRPGGARQGTAEDGSETDAADWIVKDRPKIGFDDI